MIYSVSKLLLLLLVVSTSAALAQYQREEQYKSETVEAIKTKNWTKALLFADKGAKLNSSEPTYRTWFILARADARVRLKQYSKAISDTTSLINDPNTPNDYRKQSYILRSAVYDCLHDEKHKLQDEQAAKRL